VTLPDDQDHVLHGLYRLQPLAPDPVRSTRVRARCRAQLARSVSRPGQTAAVAGSMRRLFAPAVVLAGCALYVASLVSTVLHVRSLF
jgi:hypothetical protein